MTEEVSATHDERLVTALIHVRQGDELSQLKKTFDSLARQTRPLDAVVVSVSQAAHDQVRSFLDSKLESHEIDDLCVHSESARYADIVARMRERIEDARDTRIDREDHEAKVQAERDAEAEIQGQARDFTLLTPAFGTPAKPADEYSTSYWQVQAEQSAHEESVEQNLTAAKKADTAGQGRGRRAKNVDLDALEKTFDRSATLTALVPERLRQLDAEAEARRGKRRRARESDQQWFWLLSGESAPDVAALAKMLEAHSVAPGLGLLGTKHLAVEDTAAPTSRLVDLGISLTHSHRILSGVESGEIDQGQADWRNDVLAVTSPGMLVKRETFERLDGFDPLLSQPWAEIDFSTRVWRSGERVRVVPSASTRIPAGSYRKRADSEFRASQILSLIKFRSLPFALLTILALPVLSLFKALGHIVNHDAPAVWAEVRGAVKAFIRSPRAILSARKQSARLPISRRRLAPLYMPRAVAARERLDQWWTATFTDDERTRRIKRTTWGISGTTHGLEDADYGRHTVWTMVTSFTAIVASLMAMRHLLGPGFITGPGFVPVSSHDADAWDIVTSGWVPDGLGYRGPSDAFTRLISLTFTFADLIPVVVVCLGIGLSGIFAWFAAGTITRSIAVRVIASVMWMSAAPLMYSLSEGRWPLVLVHVLLPLAAERFAHAVGLPHKISQASVSAAAAAGIVLAVISTVQPILGILFLAGLAATAPWVPGRRKRLLWTALPICALHLPNISAYLSYPASLFFVSGTPLAFDEPSPLELLLFSPTSKDPLAWALGREPGIWTSALCAAPLLIALLGAIGAAFLRDTAGLVARLALAAVGISGLTALLSLRIVVGYKSQTAFTAYPGGLVTLAAGAAIIGFICVADAFVRRATHHGSRKPSVSSKLLGAVMLTCCAAPTVGWAIAGPTAFEVQRTPSQHIPAVAADQALSSERSQTAVLSQSADGVIDAQVVNSGELTIDQTSGVVEARVAHRLEVGETTDPASQRLASAIASNLSAQGSNTKIESLGDFGISYVVVSGDPESQASLINQLSVSPRFEEVTVSETGGLWRVLEPSARAIITGEGLDAQSLPSKRTSIDADIQPAPVERELRLAERFDTGWKATLGAKELEATRVNEWQQGFRIPSGASGNLRVEYSDPVSSTLTSVGFAAGVLTLLIALPRRRKLEDQS